HMFDPLTLSATSIMGYFSLYADYAIYRPDLKFLHLARDIVLVNGLVKFDQLNSALNIVRLPALSWNVVQSFRKLTHNWKRIWNTDSARFHVQRLEHFPHMSRRLRVRVLLLSSLMERAISMFSIFTRNKITCF